MAEAAGAVKRVWSAFGRRWWLTLAVLGVCAGAAWLAKSRVLAWRHRSLCLKSHDYPACVEACYEGAAGDDGCMGAADNGPETSGADLEFLVQACRGGVVRGCQSAAIVVEHAQYISSVAWQLVPRKFDPLHAELTLRGCELGDRFACAHAANEWAEHDDAKWSRAVVLRCQHLPKREAASSCAKAFSAFQARDVMLRPACAAGDARACHERGLALLEPHPGGAIGALSQECKLRGVADDYREAVPCEEGCDWYDGPRVLDAAGRCALTKVEQGHERGTGHTLTPPPPPLAADQQPELVVRLSDMQVRRGALTGAEAVLGSEELLAELRGCFAGRTADPASAAKQGGKVVLRAVVDRLGEVDRVLSSGSDVPDGQLVGCFLARTELLRFAASKEAPALVEVTYLLSAGLAKRPRRAP